MKKSKLTWILYTVVIVLVIIQFIHPAPNNGEALGPNDIRATDSVPADVLELLDKACFDCHSNHTRPMWYMQIQPVGFWINHHIEEGKHYLNFSEFATYKAKRQRHKLEECVEEMKEHEMPMTPYLWMHPEARLNDQQLQRLIDWAQTAFENHGGEGEIKSNE